MLPAVLSVCVCVCACACVCVHVCACVCVCACLYTCAVCTSLYSPGYPHEHKPETLMIGHQYYAYRQQEVTICTKIEVNISSISDKMFLLSMHCQVFHDM